MRLSWSHDPDREFNKLTRIDLGHFLVISLIIFSQLYPLIFY
jgi:hypothetical protein